MNRLLEKIRESYDNNFGKILVLTILNGLIYFIDRFFYGKYRWENMFSQIGRLAFSFLIMFIFLMAVFTILYLVGKKFTNIILNIFIIISSIMFIVEFVIFYNFRLIISLETITILSQTTKNESKEFINTYLNLKLIIILIVMLVALYLVSKIKLYIHSKKIIKFLSLFMLVQLVLVKDDWVIIKSFTITRLIRDSQAVRENNRAVEEYAKKLNNDIKIIANNGNIDDIVVIIGETISKNHMSLYGYDKDTNPKLEQLYGGGTY